MYLSGLDEIDRKMLDLLTQNARYTYSELGERLGAVARGHQKPAWTRWSSAG